MYVCRHVCKIWAGHRWPKSLSEAHRAPATYVLCVGASAAPKNIPCHRVGPGCLERALAKAHPSVPCAEPDPGWGPRRQRNRIRLTVAYSSIIGVQSRRHPGSPPNTTCRPACRGVGDSPRERAVVCSSKTTSHGWFGQRNEPMVGPLGR
jgi:hypothetical protein